MSNETVKVMVRCRPLNSSEKAKKCNTSVSIDNDTNQIVLKKPGEDIVEKDFSYDYVFGPATPQPQIYEESAFSLVESVVEGYNGTIFAYGQTGCGKTHTMIGDPSSDEGKGIIPRTFEHIIAVIESTKDKQFLVRVSFIEIYNEEVHDLLSKDVKARYELKESPEKGVFIKDLNQMVVHSVSEMEKYLNLGNKSRSTGETLMNNTSSRSHCIFTLYIENSVEAKIRAGKLNLVDLAGSERQSKTQATGDRLKEAQKINLSLSALGNVISALVDGKSSHIPYRDSKLTRLLQDSLGGNTKTIMIANVSPADYNYDETLSTLRYASRAKFIKNKPKINEDPKDALLREYSDEIRKLKELLERQGGSIEQPLELSSNKSFHKQGSGVYRERENHLNAELQAREEAFLEEKSQREKLEKLMNDMMNGKSQENTAETVEMKKYK